jgi:hypothetical protein
MSPQASPGGFSLTGGALGTEDRAADPAAAAALAGVLGGGFPGATTGLEGFGNVAESAQPGASLAPGASQAAQDAIANTIANQSFSTGWEGMFGGISPAAADRGGGRSGGLGGGLSTTGTMAGTTPSGLAGTGINASALTGSPNASVAFGNPGMTGGNLGYSLGANFGALTAAPAVGDRSGMTNEDIAAAHAAVAPAATPGWATDLSQQTAGTQGAAFGNIGGGKGDLGAPPADQTPAQAIQGAFEQVSQDPGQRGGRDAGRDALADAMNAAQGRGGTTTVSQDPSVQANIEAAHAAFPAATPSWATDLSQQTQGFNAPFGNIGGGRGDRGGGPAPSLSNEDIAAAHSLFGAPAQETPQEQRGGPPPATFDERFGGPWATTQLGEKSTVTSSPDWSPGPAPAAGPSYEQDLDPSIAAPPADLDPYGPPPAVPALPSTKDPALERSGQRGGLTQVAALDPYVGMQHEQTVIDPTVPVSPPPSLAPPAVTPPPAPPPAPSPFDINPYPSLIGPPQNQTQSRGTQVAQAQDQPITNEYEVLPGATFDERFGGFPTTTPATAPNQGFGEPSWDFGPATAPAAPGPSNLGTTVGSLDLGSFLGISPAAAQGLTEDRVGDNRGGPAATQGPMDLAQVAQQTQEPDARSLASAITGWSDRDLAAALAPAANAMNTVGGWLGSTPTGLGTPAAAATPGSPGTQQGGPNFGAQADPFAGAQTTPAEPDPGFTPGNKGTVTTSPLGAVNPATSLGAAGWGNPSFAVGNPNIGAAGWGGRGGGAQGNTGFAGLDALAAAMADRGGIAALGNIGDPYAGYTGYADGGIVGPAIKRFVDVSPSSAAGQIDQNPMIGDGLARTFSPSQLAAMFDQIGHNRRDQNPPQDDDSNKSPQQLQISIPGASGGGTFTGMAEGGYVDAPGYYAPGGLTQAGMHTFGTQAHYSGANVRPAINPPGVHLMASSSIPGRTDRIPMRARQGSYVLPADVVSGLGQGNTMAGAKMWGQAIMAAVGGPSAMGGLRRGSMPKASVPRMSARTRGFADGGMMGHNNGPPMEDDDYVPIVTAGGEVLVDPEFVEALGYGSEMLGKRRLAESVVSVRDQTIKHLKKLPRPVK